MNETLINSNRIGERREKTGLQIEIVKSSDLIIATANVGRLLFSFPSPNIELRVASASRVKYLYVTQVFSHYKTIFESPVSSFEENDRDRERESEHDEPISR